MAVRFAAIKEVRRPFDLVRRALPSAMLPVGILIVTMLTMATASAAQAPDELDAPDAVDVDAAAEPGAEPGAETGVEPEQTNKEGKAESSDKASAALSPDAGDVDESAIDSNAETQEAQPVGEEAAIAATTTTARTAREVPFGLPSKTFGAIVAGGLTATSMVAATLLGGLPAVLVLLDLHFNQGTNIDPWAGLFIAAPIFVVTGVVTAVGASFVLENQGPMAAALGGVGAGFLAAGAVSGVVFGAAYLIEGEFPFGRDLDPYLWTAGVSALVAGTLAATAAAAGAGYAFSPSDDVAAKEIGAE